MIGVKFNYLKGVNRVLNPDKVWDYHKYYRSIKLNKKYYYTTCVL